MRAAFQTDEDIEVIGDYESVDMMLSELSRLKPDVIIIGEDGNILDRFQTCLEIRALCPTTKVLTLTEKHRDDDLHEIILSGASGSMNKDAGSSEIIRSVSIVACGGLNFKSETLIKLLGRIPRQWRSLHSAELGEFSEREGKIVTLVAQGYTNAEIGQKLNLSKFTVRNNIGEVRRKFNLKSRTELAAFAVQCGLLDDLT